MAALIRKMTAEDILDAKNVDAVCWGDLTMRTYGKQLSPRTDANLLALLHTDPDGAFVAVDEQAGMIGTCFSHIFGKTGWVGPLSVLPSYQARGTGKELLKISLNYLEDEGCVDIGLETMPENSTNMGMYLKVGLRPEGLVMVLSRNLEESELGDEPSGRITVERFSESDEKSALLGQMRAVSNALREGLDYSAEVERAQKFSFGDTIAASIDGKVVGFSVVHTKPRRETQSLASVRVLAVHPESDEEVIGPMIGTAELMGADAGCKEISIPIPATSRRALDSVFSRGYSVVRSFERMIWTGSSGMGDRHCNLCSWSW